VTGNPGPVISRHLDGFAPPWEVEYRRILRAQCGVLGFGSSYGLQSTVLPSLDEVYFPLAVERNINLRVVPGDDEVLQLITTAESLLLTGESGFGKSTLLAMAASRLCETPDLPIAVGLDVLDQLVGGGAKLVGRARALKLDIVFELAELALSELGLHPTQAELSERFALSPIVLLLDGLDEITDPPLRNKLLGLIPVWRAKWPMLRVVVAASSTGLGQGTLAVPHGMELVKLAPLTFERAAAFLERFLQHLPRRRGIRN
jgi:hypothetical protein